MNDTDLTDEERATLVDWWESDWPDTREGAIGTLFAAVAGIVAARVAAAHADAWDEGFDAGERDVFEHERGSYDSPCIRNPYRAAVADPEPPAPWCPECGPTCPLHGEPPNACPSCALGQHRCTRDLAPCDCRECA